MQTVIKTIDGVEFEFHYLTPTAALALLPRLTKMCGATIGKFIDGFVSSKPKENVRPIGEGDGKSEPNILDRDLPPNLFSDIGATLAANLNSDEVIKIVRELAAVTWIRKEGDAGTRKINVDHDFMGRPALLLKMVAGSLEVQFGDFFGEGGVSAAVLAEKARGMTRAK